jgi:hypothetical protein
MPMMISDEDLKKKFGFNREELAKVLREEFEKLTPEERQRLDASDLGTRNFPSVEEMLEFVRKAAKGESLS